MLLCSWICSRLKFILCEFVKVTTPIPTFLQALVSPKPPGISCLMFSDKTNFSTATEQNFGPVMKSTSTKLLLNVSISISPACSLLHSTESTRVRLNLFEYKNVRTFYSTRATHCSLSEHTALEYYQSLNSKMLYYHFFVSFKINTCPSSSSQRLFYLT